MTITEIGLTDLFEGARLAFIGVGGGSDCVQAGVLAKLSGKPACVLSIRTEKTGSQSASGDIGQARTVDNHGGEVCPGVYRIKPQTTGSGRFLEAIPAEIGLPVYLVIDPQDGSLTRRMQAALTDFGDVDTIYGVDTGGDSLYRATIADKTRATPDQDLASFRAIAALGVPAHSVIVAPGVDSPPYAAEVLAEADAKQVRMDKGQQTAILDLYRQMRMDGSDDNRIGKTALAWQAALRGERGPVRLPLPDRLVNDARNPWNPVVKITGEMAGAFVMRVDDHLRALQPFPAARNKLNEAPVPGLGL